MTSFHVFCIVLSPGTFVGVLLLPVISATVAVVYVLGTFVRALLSKFALAMGCCRTELAFHGEETRIANIPTNR